MVDGEIIIDNGFDKAQQQGTSFYGLGTVEEMGLKDLVAGKTYHIELLYTNIPGPNSMLQVPKKGQPTLMMAAFRVSCCPYIGDAYRAIADALVAAAECDVVICCTGSNMDWEAEGADRTRFHLPGHTDELVESLLAVKPNTIIVNQSVSCGVHCLVFANSRGLILLSYQGSAYAMPWINKATTVLQSWFGGNETGNAIVDVLLGKVNPAGRMPLSFPHEIEHCTGHINWQADNGKVLYGEGLFVGYKGYEATKRDPMFAFGEGLGYTTFGG